MRKWSYAVIIIGLLLIIYPKANEWVEDWRQERLQGEAESSFAAETQEAVAPEVRSGYENLTRLLAEEAEALDAPDPPARPADELKAGGDVIAIIEIGKIGVRLPVLEGATKDNLRGAAAHMTETAPIGTTGNAAIAAHRARKEGRLFNRLDEVEVGDAITLRTPDELYTYEVYDISIVEPTDVSVLNPQGDQKLLTLITCDPLVDPTHRLIVHARLKDGQV